MNPNPRFRAERKRWLLLLASTFLVFLVSPARQVSDSHYSMLLAAQLASHARFELDAYFRGDLRPDRHPGLRANGLPYQLREIRGHTYYLYPPGSSILSIPFVALLGTLGLSPVAPDGGYDKYGERWIQRILAALLMAGFTALVFSSARLVLPESWSLLVSLAVAFGSQVWSTASRGVWSHTWELLLLGVAVHHLLSNAVRGSRLSGALLSTALAWAYVTRPTAAISLVGVALYLLLWKREAIGAFLVGLVGWLGLFSAYSWVHFGTLLPLYFQPGRLGTESLMEGLLGNLFSPSRGLFVYVPWLIFIGYTLLSYRAALRPRALLALAAAVIAVHWFVASANPMWWGGHSYGPRLMIDVLPWQVLLTLAALRAWLNARETIAPRRLRWERRLAVASLAFAVLAQASGALSSKGGRWNLHPRNVDEQPSRVWDWSDPQFLAWHLHPRKRKAAPAAGK